MVGSGGGKDNTQMEKSVNEEEAIKSKSRS